jgi:hypothetical protein
MTPIEFAIVTAALRIGLGFESGPFRHQVKRLERHLDQIGDRDMAAKLRKMLDPPPDPYPDAKIVRSIPGGAE